MRRGWCETLSNTEGIFLLLLLLQFFIWNGGPWESFDKHVWALSYKGSEPLLP